MNEAGSGTSRSGRGVVVGLATLGVAVLVTGLAGVAGGGTGSGALPGSPAFRPSGGPLDGAPLPSASLRTTAARTFGFPDEPMAGVSFVAPGRPVGVEALEPLERITPGWIAVIPYAFLRSDDGGIRYEADRQMWGESPEGVRETVRLAREQGLGVLLKPHVWSRGGWIGDYAAASEEGWRRFEEDYRAYILLFAHLADSLDVDMLAVGTEADRSVRDRPDFWRGLIREIRAIYSGPLTYAANWDAWEDIPFWDDLDYIGVDAYFPLLDAETPGVEALEVAWRPHVEALARGAAAHGKPVLFAEYGYRSIDGAAGRQWNLPPERQRGRTVEPTPNPTAQVNAYEALFRAVWNEPWFAGGFLWKWFPGDERYRDAPNADYTPQHKPVEGVIRRWYGGGGMPGGAPADASP